jgi:hypothetical protein
MDAAWQILNSNQNDMEQNQSLFSLSIDPLTKSHLNDTAKWARFLAIAGMVLLGIALLFSLLAATVWADNENMRFTVNGREGEEVTTALRVSYVVGVIIMIAIFFFPLLFLLQFANKLKAALAANQQDDLNMAFQNLKKYFRYIGIVFLIVLAIYILMFVLALLAQG